MIVDVNATAHRQAPTVFNLEVSLIKLLDELPVCFVTIYCLEWRLVTTELRNLPQVPVRLVIMCFKAVLDSLRFVNQCSAELVSRE